MTRKLSRPSSSEPGTTLTQPRASAPSITARIAVAAFFATVASWINYVQNFRVPFHAGDFGLAWFGAKALLNGANPYVLVGPGKVYDWQWPQAYPVTAMVTAMPFTLLPQIVATVAFVWMSTALLSYAITSDGWYRLPLFLSSTFIVSAASAQWSTLLTAALCIPSLAWVFAAKPNFVLALLAFATRLTPIRTVIIGGAVITAISLALFPSWPAHWLHAVSSLRHTHAPIMLPGGIFVLLALLRWRRPEARLIVALACVPQTNSWYEALPLLLVPATYLESLALSLVSTSGWFVQGRFLVAANEIEVNRGIGTMMIAFAYLPATLIVLLKPNEGSFPPFRDLFRIGQPPTSIRISGSATPS